MEQKFTGKGVDREVGYKCWIIDNDIKAKNMTTEKLMNVVNGKHTKIIGDPDGNNVGIVDFRSTEMSGV